MTKPRTVHQLYENGASPSTTIANRYIAKQLAPLSLAPVLDCNRRLAIIRHIGTQSYMDRRYKYCRKNGTFETYIALRAPHELSFLVLLFWFLVLLSYEFPFLHAWRKQTRQKKHDYVQDADEIEPQICVDEPPTLACAPRENASSRRWRQRTEKHVECLRHTVDRAEVLRVLDTVRYKDEARGENALRHTAVTGNNRKVPTDLVLNVLTNSDFLPRT